MSSASEILIIIERAVLALLMLLLITKMLGKKQLSQMTVYDYVVGITIGSIAADSIVSIDKPFFNGIVALITFGLFALIISYAVIKNIHLNKLINGCPTILMENGEFVFDNLKRTKIPIYKFVEQARLMGYYDLNVINYAILETSGQISFLPKEEYQMSNPKDFKASVRSKVAKQTYCYNLIVDGNIQFDALNEYGKDEEWLNKELKKLKVNDIHNVLLLTVDEKNKLKLYKELM